MYRCVWGASCVLFTMDSYSEVNALRFGPSSTTNLNSHGEKSSCCTSSLWGWGRSKRHTHTHTHARARAHNTQTHTNLTSLFMFEMRRK